MAYLKQFLHFAFLFSIRADSMLPCFVQLQLLSPQGPPICAQSQGLCQMLRLHLKDVKQNHIPVTIAILLTSIVYKSLVEHYLQLCNLILFFKLALLTCSKLVSVIACRSIILSRATFELLNIYFKTCKYTTSK